MIFHKDLGLPKGYRRPTGVVLLAYSEHAMDQAFERGIGVINRITLNRCDVIEVGLNPVTRRVNHYLLRHTLPCGVDVCLAVAPGAVWTVKTCYLNSTTDNHSTLDPTRYEVPNV